MGKKTWKKKGSNKKYEDLEWINLFRDKGDSQPMHKDWIFTLSESHLQNAANEYEYMKYVLKVYSSHFVTKPKHE